MGDFKIMVEDSVADILKEDGTVETDDQILRQYIERLEKRTLQIMVHSGTKQAAYGRILDVVKGDRYWEPAVARALMDNGYGIVPSEAA